MVHHLPSPPGKTTNALGTERWQFLGTNFWRARYDDRMSNTCANGEKVLVAVNGG